MWIIKDRKSHQQKPINSTRPSIEKCLFIYLTTAKKKERKKNRRKRIKINKWWLFYLKTFIMCLRCSFCILMISRASLLLRWVNISQKKLVLTVFGNLHTKFHFFSLICVWTSSKQHVLSFILFLFSHSYLTTYVKLKKYVESN
jgi:hypothetical protein